MTAQDVERLRREHETRVWRAFLYACGLCLCAVIPPLFSTLGILKPQAEPLGQWFARGGAMMTVIAVFAQFKAASIGAMIQGRTFEESWGFYRKYKRGQTIVPCCRWCWWSLAQSYGDMGIWLVPASAHRGSTAGEKIIRFRQ
jgi:hypothetical protein